MCLSNLFLNSSLKTDFSIAHVNFSLRGEDSDGDEELVRKWAKEHNIPFYRVKFDTIKYAQDNSISTQMAARDLRYDWFKSLMDENGIGHLAVAHNLNDSVETFFLNVLRGTGMKGVTGIKEKNGRIIRPMLSFTRAQIEEYVREKGIHYREDSTNRESHYYRNRIRNEVFPYFYSINPSFLLTLQKEMNRFSQAGEILDKLFEEKEKKICSKEGDVFLVSIPVLKAEQFESYWLYRILDEYGFNDAQIAQINESLDRQSGKVFHTPSYTLVRDREYLKLYSNERELEEEKPQIRIRSFKKPLDFNPVTKDNSTLYLDGRKLIFPLKCRLWRSADRFKPLGMKGFKKISDFLTDLKMDIEEKKKQMVVTTLDRAGKEHIVCVVGLRIDDRYKIRPVTKQVVSITKI